MEKKNDVILEVKNLCKYFPANKGMFSKKSFVKAVDNVSFTIKRGETLGLVGESGCGKTSVLIGLVTSAVDYIWNRFGQGYSEIFYNELIFI